MPVRHARNKPGLTEAGWSCENGGVTGLSPLGLAALILLGCSPRADDAPARTPDSAPPPLQTTVPPVAAEWRIVPSRSAGPLTSESSEADLRQRYGPEMVSSTRIQIGEGETMPGTVLFPGDSLRTAEIIWADSVRRSRPTRFILRGSRSLWQTAEGISLGTTLQELERLNGRPFTLAGFGWDYGGVVIDWAGGALHTALAGVKLYLDPGPEQYRSAPYSQVLGDRDYSSSLKPMQQMNPKVSQVFVDFD
jgi:hypothetical protein